MNAPTLPRTLFALALGRAMDEQKWSTAVLSRKLPAPKANISQWRNGHALPRDHHTVRRLEELLGVPRDALMESWELDQAARDASRMSTRWLRAGHVEALHALRDEVQARLADVEREAATLRAQLQYIEQALALEAP